MSRNRKNCKCLSVYSSHKTIKVIYQSYLSLHLSIHLSIYMSACRSVCLPVYLPVCLSVCCLSVNLSIYPTICMYVYTMHFKVTCQIFIRHLLVTLTLKVRIKTKKYTILVEANINQFGLFACSQIYTMKYIGTPSCNCCCLNNAQNFCN